jgi:predicted esterase
LKDGRKLRRIFVRKVFHSFIIGLLLLSLLSDAFFFITVTSALEPENFTVIALPDTQFYASDINVGIKIFGNQTQWVANNVKNLKITFVTHEGDIVDNGGSVSQWKNAAVSMKNLDSGNVSWEVLPGNHDFLNDPNLINYNTYFGYGNFSSRSWFGGAYPVNTNTNNFALFSGGNDKYLIINFQYEPSDAVLSWANNIIAAYPNRRVIVTTHEYLNVDGSRSTEGNHIWNGFVAPHADQVFLVLCGHNHGEARRTDIVNGHAVFQLLADYQERTNGGNGWLRILEFRPSEDKIYVKTFSPYLNSYENDSDSYFSLDYDMTGSIDTPISITLQSPDNNTITMDNMPDFKFVATNPTYATFKCTLWLGNATFSNAFAIKNNVVNGSQTTLTPTVPVSNGNWWWWINYTDGLNSVISVKRKITINVFRGDKTFISNYDASTRNYWLDLPDNFDNQTPTPLVFFLHGYGGSRLSYSQKYTVLRKTFQNHTWIVAATDCRTVNGYQNWYVEPSRQDITDVLNILKHDYNIDSSHVHVMGNSMGGGGTLKYAMFNNEVIASVVDIHGITNFTQFYYETSTYKASLVAAYGGTPSQVPAVYANESPLGNEHRFMHTPVMMLHGTADDVVSVSQSRNLNQSLSALGYTVKYIEVPGIGHDMSLVINGKEDEIFDWLNDHPLQQAPLVQVSLLVQVSGNGITNNTGTTLHNQYERVTVQATPNSGYMLSYWLLNGTNVGSINPYTVYMTANYNLTVVFAPVPVAWWNPSWLYRKPVVLTEKSGTGLSNYQIKVIVNYVTSKMKSDFSDLRFTDTDKITLLPFWIESYNSTAAIVWIKVPSIQASGTKTIYMYYGNPNAVSAANGTATFDFFDDFNDGTINTSKWITTGTVRETNGYLQVGSGSGSVARQNTALYPLFSRPYMLRSRSFVSTTGYVSTYVGLSISGLTRYALAPHSYRSYYTYDGSTYQYTSNTAGLRSFAVYDIVWTSSNVKYYQNGVLRATHTNSPSVAMGAYLGGASTAYVRCDWIFVHKYASAEPSTTTGQEENQGYVPVQVTLTVTVSGNGITNATGVLIYPQYTKINILATPNPGFMLSNWLLNGTNVGSTNPYTINMTTNYSLTAVFVAVPLDQVSLSVGVIGNGVTNVTGVHTYNRFTKVTILATSGSGYVFDHWLLNGTNVSSANPFTLNMTNNFELTAVFVPFVPSQVSLTVGVNGNGVTNATGTKLYDKLSTVTVLATPNSGYILSYWLLNGTNVGSANPYTINMTANYSLTAVFTPTPVKKITRVQGNTKGTSTSNTISVTMSSTPTSGNVLIATIAIYDKTVSSISQTGVSWTKQISSQYSSSYLVSEIWLGVIGSGASKSITITLSGNSYSCADVCEYSGIATSNFLDKTATAKGTTTATNTGTTATTTQADELLIGCIMAASVAQSSPTNSFTLLDGASTGYLSNAYLERIVSSTGAYSSGTTATNNDGWSSCIATFKAATG